MTTEDEAGRQAGISPRLSAALSAYSAAFSAREKEGLIVREFGESRDGNALVFGYLLDGVRDASSGVRANRCFFDHEPLCKFLVRHLAEEGHLRAASLIDSYLASMGERPSGETADEQFRLAHMFRNLRFSKNLAKEMSDKGIWPTTDPIALYMDMYQGIVKSLSLHPSVMSQDDFVFRISAEISAHDIDAARLVETHQFWRRSIHT